MIEIDSWGYKVVRSAIFFLISFASINISKAAPFPPEVQIEISKKRNECKPEKVILNDGFVSKKDVNGDGIEDYIVDYGAFQCGDSSILYCGSAGCLHQVFVSSNGKFTKAFDDNVQDLTFKRLNGRPAMVFGFHGTECGKRGFEPCGAILYWNGSKFSPAN